MKGGEKMEPVVVTLTSLDFLLDMMPYVVVIAVSFMAYKAIRDLSFATFLARLAGYEELTPTARRHLINAIKGGEDGEHRETA